ncbi:hypothetical protein MKZ38_002559 [Zalerion maritima]|uniref:Uncharacterized protein n=1 Tax=Zalerion maritima TaxID=339359 RepID=A0AAD5RQC6_9PEZI|nr:hypothetical protein MKZ38_002559 [Zalerion maritima]
MPRDPTREEELLTALEFLPLAITQFTCYINRGTPRATIQKYLNEYYLGEEKQHKLLSLSPSEDIELGRFNVSSHI